MSSVTEILSLADARLHLRGGDELPDETLEAYIAAAVAIVEGVMGRPVMDAAKGWTSSWLVPANVIHAVKVALTDIYENREAPLHDEAVLRRLLGPHIRISIG